MPLDIDSRSLLKELARRDLLKPDSRVLENLSRRDLLKLLMAAGSAYGIVSLLEACGGTPSGSASPGAALPKTSSVTVACSGGVVTDAFMNAFLKPFQAQTGLTANQTLRDSVEGTAAAQVKSQVETNHVLWDVAALGQPTVVLLRNQKLLESLDGTSNDYHQADLLPGTLLDDYVGAYEVALVVAYRSDKFTGSQVPNSFADFWDTARFPGRRGIFNSGLDVMEPAVLSSGVKPEQLYPLDVNLAFKQLDKIKSHVNVWWSNLAESTQALHDGSVDLAITFNARAQPAIDAGAPVKISWGQWVGQTVGLCIPKGAPNLANARKFISFATSATPQASLTKYLKYGPTNTKAYDMIDKAVADILPGSPNTRPGLVSIDPTWRSTNTANVTDRFTAWLAS